MPLFLIARIAGQGVVFDADQVDAVVDIGEVVDVPRVDPSIRGLAALYTGHLSAFQLQLMGRLDGPESDLDQATAIFAGPAPWMSDRF